MKKFLTFVFLLLGISFLGTNTLEAYCAPPSSDSFTEKNSYYACLQREQQERIFKEQAERTRKFQEEQRRYMEERRRQSEERRRSIDPSPRGNY